MLEPMIHDITGIAIQALRGSPLAEFTVNERMLWAEKRKTKHEEDEARCELVSPRQNLVRLRASLRG